MKSKPTMRNIFHNAEPGRLAASARSFVACSSTARGDVERRSAASRRGGRRRFANGGFTLVEILVALALMSLLLTIIFVPLNQAFNFFGIGQSRTKLQQASRQTLSQIEIDLQRAIYVYPNGVLPSVTSNDPYGNLAPYYKSATASGNAGIAAAYDVCASTRAANSSRIDMLMPEIDDKGQVINPVIPGDYVVTYYARRLRVDAEYDPFTNPIVWFRAQMPFRKNDNSTDPTFYASGNSGPANVNTANTRYPTACTANDSRGSRWLVQDAHDEPDLEPLCNDAPTSVPGTHTLALPRGISLIAPSADLATNPSYQPDASFVVDDINGDGKVDQVTVNLALEQYDTAGVGNTNGAKPKSSDRLGVQRFRDSVVVNLPNVK